MVSNPRNRPTRHLDPYNEWSLGAAGGQPSAHSGGQRWFHRGPRGEKNLFFFKVVPRPLGMLKQVFLARFEPMVTPFGPWKLPKCRENGPFQDQKWVKNGSKTSFSEIDHGPFGMLKQVFLAHFELVVTRFGPWKIPKCLENGVVWDPNWVKNGSKTHFSKSDHGPLGMLKQLFLAHFEPVVTRFCPWKIKCQNVLKRGHLGPKMGQKWVQNAFFHS